jgi:hypothetical protein
MPHIPASRSPVGIALTSGSHRRLGDWWLAMLVVAVAVIAIAIFFAFSHEIYMPDFVTLGPG